MKTFAVHCLGRMGFGHKITNNSSDIADFEALGNTDDERLSAYLALQLDWQGIDDSAFESMVASENYVTLDKPLAQMWIDHRVNKDAADFDRNAPSNEAERLAFSRAVHSKRQLLEILADFWHNHFNVYLRSNFARSVFMSWDRDVIRPPVNGHPRPPENINGHLMGNFRQMLELSSQHVAMNEYLDNYINRFGGPNENYAREVIELHTLGAENYVSLGDPDSISQTELSFPWGKALISDQYVDDDVYAAMRMLTGWKIKIGSNDISSNFKDTGEFFYYEPWHDPFEKTILGYEWGNFEDSPEDIMHFFDILAYHPGTARHIAGKLCKRFISDTPSQAIIDSVADTFYQNRYAANQLELVYQTLFLSAEFKNPSNYNKKLKRPLEATVGAMRVCGSDLMLPAKGGRGDSIMWRLERARQRPFYWASPDGYPDEQSSWVGGVVLVNTMRLYDWMVDVDHNNVNRVVPIREITSNASPAELPSHSPNNLTTFWMNRIIGYEPAGGWEGTQVHTKLRDFMRQNGDSSELEPADIPLTNVVNGSSHVNGRLRGLVKLILTTPEFMYR